MKHEHDNRTCTCPADGSYEPGDCPSCEGWSQDSCCPVCANREGNEFLGTAYATHTIHYYRCRDCGCNFSQVTKGGVTTGREIR